MVWLVVVGLMAWAAYLTVELSALRRRSEDLERKLFQLNLSLGGEPEPRPVRRPEPPGPELKPEPVKPPAEVMREAVSPRPERIVAPPPREQEAVETAAVAAPPPQPRQPSAPRRQQQIRGWLEENLLAWAGGAALALGGLFLVAYAAQRGVFTPAMRIAAAVVVGAIMLAASEWLKRRTDSALPAALAAGAGAATLYGAAWSASALFGLIGQGVGGSLLAAVSLGLLALAFRHGQALALLALIGGFLAPMVTDVGSWDATALSLYLGLLTVTGFGVAGARRWGQAGSVTLAGTVVWALLGLLANSPERVALLAVGPAALAVAAHEWRRRRHEAEDAAKRDAFSALPLAAVGAAAAFLLAMMVFSISGAALPAASVGAIALLGVSAWGVRQMILPAPLQLLAYAVAGSAALWSPALLALDTRPWQGLLILTVIAAGVAHAIGRDGKGARWAGGAAAAALALAMAMAAPAAALAWAPETLTAVVLLGAAAVLARSAADRETALSPAIWTWTAGAAGLAALNEALDPRYLPLGVAAMALAVALMHARLRWRGFAAVTLAASLAALTAIVSPLMIEALQRGGLAWPVFAAVAAASAAMIFAAAWITGRVAGSRASAEALGTGAIVVGLAGAFLLLRPWGPAGGMDPFLEASLRTLLILVAGLTAALATPLEKEDAEGDLAKNIVPAALEELRAAVITHDGPGLIGRWRGQALLLVGLAHAVVFQLIAFNPLLNGTVAGPPILDSLLVGLLVPAALLAVATLRRVAIRKPLLAAYGLGAAGLAFAWELMEARRLFHGPTLTAGADVVGRAEIAVYAILGLLAAGATMWAGLIAAKRPLTISPFAAEVTALGRMGAWVALGGAVLTFGYAASPWWGPIDRPLESPLVAVFLLGLYAAGIAATLALWPPARRADDPTLIRGVRLTAVAVIFALTNLAVRIGFRGLDMRPDLREASLETWAFSAVWGLFGFGLVVWGAARRSNDLRVAGLAVLAATTAKIFLFDMARLDGMTRAASFLAVGALLLGAAVAVRRLTRGAEASAKPGAES